MPDLTVDLENAAGDLNQPKVIYAGDAYQGQPYILYDEDQIVLVGDKNNAVNISPEFGVLLAGKLSLSAMPDQIAFGGGYWRLNPSLVACLPSTTPTPIPTFIPATPELFRSQDAISSCESSLLANSDMA